jgi:CRP/FNR family transcriptional regulator, nitrogen oxide reductase regulator
MGQPAVNSIASAFENKTARPYIVSPTTAERATSTDLSHVLRRRTASVQHFEAFSDLPVADCMAIVASAQERQFGRRHTVFLEGDPVRHVVLLLSGCLKVTQLGTNGQEVILRLNGPGDVLGRVGRRADSEHFSTAQTLQPTSALVWETNRFEAFLDRLPLLRRNMGLLLERHLNELEVRFREVSTEKVAPRLSSLLVRLLDQVGKRADSHVEIALSRRELAQLTGTTLFTVSRLLCQWETQGIVSARRETVLVHNVPALQELSRVE